jgi:hypothetical protein
MQNAVLLQENISTKYGESTSEEEESGTLLLYPRGRKFDCRGSIAKYKRERGSGFINSIIIIGAEATTVQ